MTAKFIFPKMLREAVHALNHEFRWKIIEELARKPNQTWTQLHKALGKPNPNTLNFHLRTLQDGGIIVNQIVGFKPLKTTWTVSSFGVELLTGMWRTLMPPLPAKKRGSKKK